MKVAEYILEVLNSQERQKSWLADKTNISKQAINYKFKNNSFTAEELLILSEILNINLEELKVKCRRN